MTHAMHLCVQTQVLAVAAYLSYGKTGDETDYAYSYYCTRRIEISHNDNVHALPIEWRNGVLYLASRMQRRSNLRDPLFWYYSAETVRFNRPASSSTMLILIFNRMSNRKEHAQWPTEFNRQTKTHSIAHHFVVNYLCECFEAFKLSGGDQITM